jgi:hypothetical protein
MKVEMNAVLHDKVSSTVKPRVGIVKAQKAGKQIAREPVHVGRAQKKKIKKVWLIELPHPLPLGVLSHHQVSNLKNGVKIFMVKRC